MSTLSFNVKLSENNSTIAQNMLNALLPDINQYFNNVYQKMKTNIPPIVIRHVKAQPEYVSLIGGKLKGEFGLVDASSRIEEILSTMENNLIIDTKPLSVVNGKIKGSVRLRMVQKDFSDLLSLGASSFVTEKGSELNWLQWLLIEGDTVIIADYSFALGSFPSSRTGMGIMKQFGGPSWRVPPEFAGSINNNWITRAINSASADIQKELESISRI